MNETKLGSGWMTWRFFGWSLLFWISSTLLQMVVPLFAGPVEFGGMANVLRVMALGVLPYALLTPPLFAFTERFSRRRARGLPYVARLAAVIVIASLVRTAAWGVELWSDSDQVSSMLMMMFLGEWMRCGAIVATAAAVVHYRIGQERHRELLQAQLDALRSQVQPHFLFNTLQAVRLRVTTRTRQCA